MLEAEVEAANCWLVWELVDLPLKLGRIGCCLAETYRNLLLVGACAQSLRFGRLTASLLSGVILGLRIDFSSQQTVVQLRSLRSNATRFLHD